MGGIPFLEEVEASVEFPQQLYVPVSGFQVDRNTVKLRVSVSAISRCGIEQAGPVDLGDDPPETSGMIGVESLCITHCRDLLLATYVINAFRTKNAQFDEDTCRPGLKELPSKFFYGNVFIESITFPSSWKFDTPGRSLFRGCRRLKAIDLLALFTPNTTVTIPDWFVANCTSVSRLDLSPFRNVTTIGSDFLCDSWRIAELDLTPLENIRSIGPAFLCGCAGLKTINLTPLHRITKIEDSFLEYCEGLKELDFTSLINVSEIDSEFLWGCGGLTTLDLTPLKMALVSESDDEDESWRPPVRIGKCSSLKVVKVAKGSKIIWEDPVELIEC